MATYNKFEDFVNQLGQGLHNLSSTGATLKVYASNAAPSSTADTVKADLAEITAQNGYPSGGSDVNNGWSEATGTGTLTCDDTTWTASGGSFGPLQYVAMYNDSTTTTVDALICWWDYGSSVTVNDGETFTVDFGASTATIS